MNKFVQLSGLSNAGTVPISFRIPGFTEKAQYRLDVVATANFSYGKTKSIRLVDASGASTAVEMTGHRIVFGNETKKTKKSGFKARQLNRFCFSVRADHVRFFINGKFFHRSDVAMTGLSRVEFDGIERQDAVFSVSTSPSIDCG